MVPAVFFPQKTGNDADRAHIYRARILREKPSSGNREMNLLRIIVHGYLHAMYGLRIITGTGAFGREKARIVRGPVSADGKPLKKALFRYHVKQFNEASCSVATVATVLNAVMASRGLDPGPVTQTDILETVRTGHWKERMSENGHNGRRGLPLERLGKVVKSSFDTYGIRYDAVEIVQARKRKGPAAAVQKMLRQRLHDFETRGTCLVIAHFDQGALVRTLNIPHISPVGGFDPHTGEVTVLDVDPEQETPYTVAFDTFYRALASDYHHAFKPFGYGSGGYVCVRLDR